MKLSTWAIHPGLVSAKVPPSPLLDALSTPVGTESCTTRRIQLRRWIWPLFSMYLERAGEEDKKMTDSWKADADGILIFTGLFSAAVATLVAVSVQDLRPSSQDISAFYLASIYQLLADANGSRIFLPPRCLIHPSPSLHQAMPSGSTRSGSSAWLLVLRALFWQRHCSSGRVGT
ncbi:hypothetical protein BC826DRAFT_158294 [Russula brevipes]|nr:hypothetical protein BC826DRAFT_158294 [Russula brevipes]